MNVPGLVNLVTAAALASSQLIAATAPTPQPSAQAAARFLQQASWGPTPATIARVQQIGFDAWITEQMNATLTPISSVGQYSTDTKGNTSLRPVQDQFFYNAQHGTDQLRQRVAFALGQIWVVSGVKLAPEAITPYLTLLHNDAFTTYDKLLYDVTLSPAMGHYLDMVNNNKPNPVTGQGANENYAREVLQLFTIGLNELNDDGSLKLDSKKQPIPTYNQDTIEAFANTFTGWTYGPAVTPAKFPAPANWTVPMVPVEAHHDTLDTKAVFGTTIHPGGTAEGDLALALKAIFTHPNVGPFVCKQLIQHLVTSNPSAAYITRVVKVFNNPSKRGDLSAVVKAILLDTEARSYDAATAPFESVPPTEGHLREPAVFVNALVRGLAGTVAAPPTTNGLVDASSQLGQTIFYPQTVFNYFLPGYEVDDSLNGITMNAPEFQLLSESTALGRANWVNQLAYGHVNGVTLDLSKYTALVTPTAAVAHPTSDAMVQALNVDLMGGRMPADMKGVIITAANSATTPTAKVQAAVYLIGSSWQFQVEQ